MASTVLRLPMDICAPVQIGNLGALFKTSSASDEVLGSKEERLIDSLVSALDTYCLAVITAPTLAEFRRERKKAWPKYVRSLRALNDTFLNLVPENVIAQLSQQALMDLESDIQHQGPSTFGQKLTEQSAFTLWTINEIRALRTNALGNDVPQSLRQRDSELASEYYGDSLWAQFHLDSLIAAIKFNRPVSEEIRAEVCEGLRAAVNAFAIIKDAETLRVKPSSIESAAPVTLPWDDEDERLLNSSMRDINADFSEDS